jgi:transcriptional regulator with XRE-family HTH domain
MRLTGPQIEAAMSLAGITREALCKEASIAKKTLNDTLNNKTSYREDTIRKIRSILEIRGIEFIENQGVRLKPHSLETFEGREGFTRFYEVMHEHLRAEGGDICVSGADEKLFAKYRDNPEQHRQRMVELLKEQPNLKMRILVAEGDYNFTASGYATYRWQPKEQFSPTAFYVFGDCLALISFSNDPAPLVILINSPAFAEAYRHSFNIVWMNAHEPSPKEK